MKLLIVESAGKASRLLGMIRKADQSDEWEVISCEGHYAGLPPKTLGFDPKNGFSPSWKSIKTKVLKRIQSAMEGADVVYAATDFGADGEAIAYQISITASKTSTPFYRIRRPIRDDASLHRALENPGEIDQSLFQTHLAQEAIDRFIRFRLGSAMGKRLGVSELERIPALLLTELARRERKIRRFTSKDYWVVRALLANGAVAVSDFIESKADANAAAKRCKTAEPSFYSAMEKVNPPLPFTTSTLLQFLADRYGYLSNHSMHICNTLYGLGYITNPQTSSLFVDESYLAEVRDYIHSTFGEELLSSTAAKHGSDSQVEAIRPTEVSLSPSKINLKGDLKTVYQSIWFNSLATQGPPALIDKQECQYRFPGSTSVVFRATGAKLAFAGWHQLSSRLFLEQNQELFEESLLIDEASVVPTKKSPPKRHSFSSIISWLDTKLVGRPRNYASSISFLLESGYAEANQGRLRILPRGEAVLTFLKKAVPDLIDSDFHAEVEEEIDSIEEGKISFESFAKDYWEWTLRAEEKLTRTSLRPRFKAPGGSKARIWVGHNEILAFSTKEDWKAPVVFDSKGHIQLKKPD